MYIGTQSILNSINISYNCYSSFNYDDEKWQCIFKFVQLKDIMLGID